MMHRIHGHSSRAALGLRIGTLVATVVCIGAVHGESIWESGQKQSAFLYTDNVAAVTGDSITILVSDQSSFTKDAEREMEQSASASGSLNVTAGLVDFTIPAGDLTQTSERTFEGSSEYSSSRQFTDSITGTVVDELPNGNLVIAGRSERHIAGEEMVTIVTGVVRPEDISGANTITSTRIANLSLYYETNGPEDGFTKGGFLTRLLHAVWPF